MNIPCDEPITRGEGRIYLASSQSQAPAATCMYFRKGLCRFGTGCRYSHDSAGTADRPIRGTDAPTWTNQRDRCGDTDQSEGPVRRHGPIRGTDALTWTNRRDRCADMDQLEGPVVRRHGPIRGGRDPGFSAPGGVPPGLPSQYGPFNPVVLPPGFPPPPPAVAGLGQPFLAWVYPHPV